MQAAAAKSRAGDATAATMTNVQPFEDNELLPPAIVTQVRRLKTVHAGDAFASPCLGTVLTKAIGLYIPSKHSCGWNEQSQITSLHLQQKGSSYAMTADKVTL